MAMFNTGVSLRSLLENPSLLNPPHLQDGGSKLKEGKDKLAGSTTSTDPSAAFLAPLWDKTIGYDDDFQLEYMDLDEFLLENGIPGNNEQQNENSNGSGSSQLSQTLSVSVSPPRTPPMPTFAVSPGSSSPCGSPTGPSSPGTNSTSVCPTSQDKPNSPLIKINFDVAPQDLALVTIPGQGHPHCSPIQNGYGLVQQPMLKKADLPCESKTPTCSPHETLPQDVSVATVPGQEGFDPRTHRFGDEELKPQPMIKKSKKVFIPEDLKDEKYWSRRRKNNVAAKRSRDARRIKENQIAMRASYLEKENSELKKKLENALEENKALLKKISAYEGKV